MISRKYLYLIALAREKHFGRAAAACHISPSTLSAVIRDIESEYAIMPQGVLELIGAPHDVKVLPLIKTVFHWMTGLIVAGRKPWLPLITALLYEAQQLKSMFGKTEQIF